MYERRQYLIIPVSEIPKVDFSLICETSVETLRFSVDGTKTFIKWELGEPPFTANLVDSQGPYTHEEFLQILRGPEWTPPIEEV